jgi:hypothetical protein
MAGVAHSASRASTILSRQISVPKHVGTPLPVFAKPKDCGSVDETPVEKCTSRFPPVKIENTKFQTEARQELQGYKALQHPRETGFDGAGGRLD